MKMTLSHRYLGANLAILETLGFPRNLALDALKIEDVDLKSSKGRMPLSQFHDCLAAAVAHTGQKDIALRLGYKFRVSSFGETGALYSYCKNLEDVMMLNNQYQKLAIDAGHAEYYQDTNERHYMRFHPHYSDAQEYRLITDVLMGSFITTYRWLSWGSGGEIVSAQLPNLEPECVKLYSEVLQTPIETKTDKISVQLSDAAMTQTITTHNPELFARVRIKLDKLLGEQVSSFDFETGVDAAIRGAILSGHVSAEVVAERMGLSLSALRVKFNETQIGFRPRVDQIRRSLFIEKSKSSKNFSQIAVELAYNDQAAMNRAFRRWYGMTPTQWCQQNPNG